MKISKRFYQFPLSSCILAVDAEHARVFLAEDGVMEEILHTHVPVKKPEGRRPLSRRPGGGQGAATELSTRKAHALTELLSELNPQLLRTIAQHKVRHVYLLAPQQHLRHIRNKLHTDVRARIRKAFGIDVTHGTPQRIVERLSHELLP